MTPARRIRAYFQSCSEGSADEVAAHFRPQAVIYDTNLAPVRGAAEIGGFWTRVRERWGGARWIVDTVVAEGDSAAIEWTMTGRDPASGRAFAFHGSEHYRFEDGLIAEIRQYWTFDRDRLDTGLVDHPGHLPAPST